MTAIPRAVAWGSDGTSVRIIDQRALPHVLRYLDLRTLDEIVDAIRTLAVRGAPAIGVAGAMGLAVMAASLATRQPALPPRAFVAALDDAATRIAAARPTAVNLPWAIARLRHRAAAEGHLEPSHLAAALRDEAEQIRADDEAMCARIGAHGAPLLRDGARVLTHCNAGALATAGIGTALAPVYAAHAAGRRVEVFATETRPLLQGARLTMWELTRAGIPCTLIVDSAAASLLRGGAADCVLVGADRIAANGDVVNKVGTYPIALAAQANGVPFYVAAPSSTIDAATAAGHDVPVEERDPDEVFTFAGARSAAAGVRARNPAFDMTPAALVAAIITDAGIVRAPYDFSAAAARIPLSHPTRT